MSPHFALLSSAVLALQTAGFLVQVVPHVITNLDGYSEGIVFDAGGDGYVSALHRDAVYRLHGNEPPAVWFRAKQPNGHKILADGSHLIAARGGIYRVGHDARLIKIVGQQIATPNDLALDGDGGVYISGPAELPKDQQAGRSKVYYLDSSGAVRQVADGFRFPNGLIVRADGRALLVSDTDTRRIYELQITAPGTVTTRRVFSELADKKAGPDGMTFDQEGHLYIADYGTGDVVVLNAGGGLLRRYATGLRHPSNVAFGGRELGELFVTGSPNEEEGPGQVVMLPLGVRGRSSLAMPASLARR